MKKLLLLASSLSLLVLLSQPLVFGQSNAVRRHETGSVVAGAACGGNAVTVDEMTCSTYLCTDLSNDGTADGDGVWTQCSSGSGPGPGCTGAFTANRVIKATASGGSCTFGNSAISEDGTTVCVISEDLGIVNDKWLFWDSVCSAATVKDAGIRWDVGSTPDEFDFDVDGTTRVNLRAITTGTNSSLDYSAQTLNLAENVTYTTDHAAQTFRGFSVQGTMTVADPELLTNGSFDGSTYCARTPALDAGSSCLTSCSGTPLNTNPLSWIAGNNAYIITGAECQGGSGGCIVFEDLRNVSSTLYARLPDSEYITPGSHTCPGNDSCTGDAAGLGFGNGSTSYFQLSKNTVYTLSFAVKFAGSVGVKAFGFSLTAENNNTNAGTCGGASYYGLSGSSSSGATSHTFSTWTLNTGGTSSFVGVPPDNTYRTYTATIDTTPVGASVTTDPFYAVLSFTEGPTAEVGAYFVLDSVSLTSTGVDSGLSTILLAEDLHTFVPKTDSSGEAIVFTGLTGVLARPTIAPDLVTGSTATLTRYDGVRAGLAYTPDADGTFSLPIATSLYAEKPGAGTQKYAAYFAWLTAYDQDADSTGVTCIADSEADDRLFGDKDCDGTKDSGEEFLDEAAGGGGGGATNAPHIKHAEDKAAATSWSVTGATHDLGSAHLSVTCYGAGVSSRTILKPTSVTINPATFDVLVTWPATTAGRIVIYRTVTEAQQYAASFYGDSTWNVAGVTHLVGSLGTPPIGILTYDASGSRIQPSSVVVNGDSLDVSATLPAVSGGSMLVYSFTTHPETPVSVTNQAASTTFTVLGSSHDLATADLAPIIYDANSAYPKLIDPTSVTVDQTTFDVSITMPVTTAVRVALYGSTS